MDTTINLERAAEGLPETDEVRQLRDRFRAFFLALAEQAAPQLQGADQARWAAVLDAERVNLDVAISWSVDAGDGTTALRLCLALRHAWMWLPDMAGVWRQALAISRDVSPVLRARALAAAAFCIGWSAGHVEEGFAMVDEAVDVARHSEDESALAACLVTRVELIALWRGPEAAIAASDGVEELVRRVGDPHLLASLLRRIGRSDEAMDIDRREQNHAVIAWMAWGRGSIELWKGRLEPARASFTESLAAARRATDQSTAPVALMFLALVEHFEGHLAAARALCEEALVEATNHGLFLRDLAMVYAQAASLYQWQNNLTRSRQLATEAVEIAERSESWHAKAEAAMALSDALAGQGDLDGARTVIAAAVASAHPDTHVTAQLLCQQAHLDVLAGQPTDAIDHARHAHGLAIGATQLVGLEAFAAAVAAGGNPRAAAQLVGAANAERERTRWIRTPLQDQAMSELVDRLRTTLADDFAAQVAAGATLSEEVVIAFIRDGDAVGGQPSSSPS